MGQCQIIGGDEFLHFPAPPKKLFNRTFVLYCIELPRANPMPAEKAFGESRSAYYMQRILDMKDGKMRGRAIEER